MYTQEPCEGVSWALSVQLADLKAIAAGIPDNLCDTLVLGGGGEMWGETVDYSDW